MQSYVLFQQALEKIGITKKNIEQAEENFRTISQKFKAGNALTTDVTDAQTALLQAKVNNIQAYIDYELASVRMDKAIGKQ
jgi:outer membrane protein TolC